MILIDTGFSRTRASPRFAALLTPDRVLRKALANSAPFHPITGTARSLMMSVVSFGFEACGDGVGDRRVLKGGLPCAPVTSNLVSSRTKSQFRDIVKLLTNFPG